eukprot:m51a1_g3831 putative dock family protein (1032) ;mRNA; f:322403-326565
MEAARARSRSPAPAPSFTVNPFFNVFVFKVLATLTYLNVSDLARLARTCTAYARVLSPKNDKFWNAVAERLCGAADLKYLSSGVVKPHELCVQIEILGEPLRNLVTRVGWMHQGPAWEHERTNILIKMERYHRKVGDVAQASQRVDAMLHSHLQMEAFVEAGNCYMLLAGKLPDPASVRTAKVLRELEATRGSSIKNAVAQFQKGMHWERAIEVLEDEIRFLRSVKADGTRDLAEALDTRIKLHEAQLAECKTLVKEKANDRVFENYFLVEYFGDDSDVFCGEKGWAGERYIARGKAAMTIASFLRILQERWPNASIVSTHATNRVPNSINVHACKPVKLTSEFARAHNLPEPIYPHNVPKESERYYDQVNSNVFLYVRPFDKGATENKNKDKKIQWKDLWVCDTYLVTETVFPSYYRWSRVSNSFGKEKPPVENAWEALEAKKQDLKDNITKIQKSDNPVQCSTNLSMVISGIIDAKVNGGMKEYAESFLTEEFIKNNVGTHRYIGNLLECTTQIAELLGQGMVLCRKYVPEQLNKFLQKMEDSYAEWTTYMQGETTKAAELLKVYAEQPGQESSAQVLAAEDQIETQNQPLDGIYSIAAQMADGATFDALIHNPSDCTLASPHKMSPALFSKIPKDNTLRRQSALGALQVELEDLHRTSAARPHASPEVVQSTKKKGGFFSRSRTEKKKKAEKEASSSELIQLQQRNYELQTELEAMSVDLRNSRTKEAQTKEEILHVHASFAAAKAAMRDQDEELLQKQRTLEAERAEKLKYLQDYQLTSDQCSLLEKEKEKLETKLKEARAENEKLRHRVRRVESRSESVGRSDLELGRLREEVEELRRECSRLTTDLVDMTTERDQALHRERSAREDSASQRARILALERELALVADEKRERDSKIDELTEEVGRLHEEQQRIARSHTALEDQLHLREASIRTQNELIDVMRRQLGEPVYDVASDGEIYADQVLPSDASPAVRALVDTPTRSTVSPGVFRSSDCEQFAEFRISGLGQRHGNNVCEAHTHWNGGERR